MPDILKTVVYLIAALQKLLENTNAMTKIAPAKMGINLSHFSMVKKMD